MAMVQRPSAAGLLLCRMVIVEEATRNVTLANSFQRLKADSFPSSPTPFYAYTVLTDGLGDMRLDLVVSQCDSLDRIYERASQIEINDPLRQVRVWWRIRSCSFPAAGRYEFGVLADGQPITQSVLELI